MADVQIAVIGQQNVQIAVIDPENTQLALAVPAEAAVNVAVPGIQGPIGTTGSVTIAQAGTAATPGIRFESDTNTGIYSPGADQLAVSTGGTGRLFVDSAGLLGLGTSAPSSKLTVSDGAVTAGVVNGTYGDVLIGNYSSTFGPYFKLSTNNTDATNGGLSIFTATSGSLTEKVCVNEAGRVGIGTTTPDSTLHVLAGAVAGLRVGFNGTSVNYYDADTQIFRNIAGTERLRIDSSGRLLVGTSTSRSNFFNTSGIDHLLQLETSNFYAQSFVSNGGTTAAGAAILTLARSRGTTAGSYTVVSSGDSLGRLSFQGADGTDFVGAAEISAEVDGTPGANDMPGRLVFSVTADGAASPTEALRISNDRSITVSDGGNVVLGTTTGTKIGTATTQKLGFYNATPVVQPAAVADATDAATVITQLNDLLAKLRTLGIIAT
jgi:hypothetical protein